LISSNSQLEDIRTALGNYAATLSFETAAPNGYITASFASYGWRGEPYDPYTRDQFVKELYYLRTDTEQTRDRLRAIADADPASPYGQLITTEQRVEYRNYTPPM
jgi:hypothetical protein